MEKKEIIHSIMQQVESAQNNEVYYQNIYQDNTIRLKHQFLFFIKPEITINNNAVDQKPILEMMFEQFDRFRLNVNSINILGAAYLNQYNIIAQHYGVINALSKNPRTYLSFEARQKFKSIYNQSTDEVKLLGSIEFLHQYPAYNAHTLNELWQAGESVRLGGGAYCVKVSVGSEIVFLINGFHPLQMIHFTDKGRSIVTFLLCGDLDWSVARNNFIGKTNPAEAASGSLRNKLLLQKDRFGLSEVSSSLNGFHLSAGPVEGLVELIRYGSDFATNRTKTVCDFSFGQQLSSVFDENTLRKICNNDPIIYKGGKTSVFDLTEEKNCDVAIDLLKIAEFQA